MDLYCTKCMEPWDLDSVLHEQPEEFKRGGNGEIVECPVCEGQSKKEILKNLADESGDVEDFKTRSAIVSAAHDLLGDDYDGIASSLEDEFGVF